MAVSSQRVHRMRRHVITDRFYLCHRVSRNAQTSVGMSCKFLHGSLGAETFRADGHKFDP
jgi:hypothetical protein